MEDRRQSLLYQLLDSIYSTVDCLRSGICVVECDAILLGSLARQMKVVDLMFQPRHRIPIHGISAEAVFEEIAGLSTPTWHHPSELEVTSIKYDDCGRVRRKKYRNKAAYDIPSHEGEAAPPLDEEIPEPKEPALPQAEECEGHPCTLQSLFRGFETHKTSLAGLDLD